ALLVRRGRPRAGELERRLHRVRGVPRRQQQHALGRGVPRGGRRDRPPRLAPKGRLDSRLPGQRAGPGPRLANTRALRPELAAPPGLQRRSPQRPVPAARHHPRPFLRMGPAAADPGGDPTRFLAARGGDRAVRHRRHRRLAAGRSPGLDLYRRRRRPARGDGPHALGRLRGRARRRRAAPAHRRGPLRRPRGRWWDEIDRYFLDREHGGWWQELAPDMTPATSTWSGKPDLYHSYQALLLPSLPLSPTAATALARPRTDPLPF